MKNQLQGNKAAMAVTLIAVLVMPMYMLGSGTAGFVANSVYPYEVTFLGFYGCIFLWKAWEGKWLWMKIILTAVNVIINGFYILMGFMVGIKGPILALMQMVIPIPWYKIFG